MVCHIPFRIFSLHISDLVVSILTRNCTLCTGFLNAEGHLGDLVLLQSGYLFWNMEHKSLSFFLHDYNQGIGCIEMEESRATRWVCISMLKLNIEAQKREYYRKKGCSHCNVLLVWDFLSSLPCKIQINCMHWRRKWFCILTEDESPCCIKSGIQHQFSIWPVYK